MQFGLSSTWPTVDLELVKSLKKHLILCFYLIFIVIIMFNFPLLSLIFHYSPLIFSKFEAFMEETKIVEYEEVERPKKKTK